MLFVCSVHVPMKLPAVKCVSERISQPFPSTAIALLIYHQGGNNDHLTAGTQVEMLGEIISCVGNPSINDFPYGPDGGLPLPTIPFSIN